MVDLANLPPSVKAREPVIGKYFALLWRDKFAFFAVVYLVVLVIAAIVAPFLLSQDAMRMNLAARNAPPFQPDVKWTMVFGADALGRSILARILVGAGNTLGIAAAAVAASMVVGALLGLVAGHFRGKVDTIIMRAADITMSFPSLLLALIVLYVLSPAIHNMIIVLAITRVPIYLRTIRAEVLEIRERMFVTAARTLGASQWRVVFKHIAPMAIPTLITVATLDFAFVMLSEASLSFLGLGIQAPNITWGLMVAEGRAYLATAGWLSFWPGLAIALTAMALNLLSNWLRTVTDPKQRWRLEGGKLPDA
jgi:peptide/nickel transport system permease protein